LAFLGVRPFFFTLWNISLFIFKLKTGGMKSFTIFSDQNKSPQATGKDESLRISTSDANASQYSVSSLKNMMQSIIHEIGNPLTAISLANQTLTEDLEYAYPSLSALTEIVAKSITRIETILKELLKVDDPRECNVLPTDICDIIEKSLQNANDRIFRKKIKVMKSYSFDMIINADPEKLSVAFLNIIINAIEAVRDHGKLWITAYKARDEVKVIFKDNGSGMHPDIASHIFDGNVSCKSNNTGIGLVSTKEILEWHNANISVNSEPGTGTTVVVSFKDVHYQ
jgi:signal transduction histidine kinase